MSGNPAAPITEDAYIYGDDNPFADADPAGLATSQDVGAPLSSVTAGYSYYLEDGDSEDGFDLLGMIGSGVVTGLVRTGAFFDGLTQPVFGGTAALRHALGLANFDTSDPAYQLDHAIGGATAKLEVGAASSEFVGGALESADALPPVAAQAAGGGFGGWAATEAEQQSGGTANSSLTRAMLSGAAGAAAARALGARDAAGAALTEFFSTAFEGI